MTQISASTLRALTAVSLGALLLGPGAAMAASDVLPVQALRDATATSSRTPDQSLLGNYLAARVARARRETEKSADFYASALQLGPEDLDLLKTTFFMQAAVGRWDEARANAKLIAKNDAKDRLSHLFLGADAVRAKRFDDADANFGASKTGPIGELTSHLALAWVDAGKGASAAAFAHLSKLDQDWARFYREYHRALIADVAGLPGLASKTWRSLFTEEPRTLRVALGYARHLAVNNDAMGAERVLNKHIRSTRGSDAVAQTLLLKIKNGEPLTLLAQSADAGLSEVFFGLGEALAGEGGVEVGTIYLQLALLLDPDRDVARYGLANVYEMTKRYDKAIDAYEKITQGSDYAFDAALRLSFTLRVMEREEDAIKELERWLNGEALRALIPAAARRKPLQTAAVAASTVTDALTSTARAAASPRNRVTTAKQLLRDLGAYEGALDGRTTPGYTKAVKAFQKEEGLTDDGVAGPVTLAALRDAVRFDITTVNDDRRRRMLMALGNALRGTKRFKEAADRYNQAIEMLGRTNSSHWNYYYARGVAYERTGQWKKAEADLRKSLELNPDQPLVLNYLGYSWVDRNENLEEAMKLIRKAVRLKPNDGYFVDSLGWAYYRQNNFAQAVRYLERATELRPEDPVINDHLGDAYWRVGRKLEARYQWKQSLDLKPEEKDIPKIKQKLISGLEPVAKPRVATRQTPATRAQTGRTRGARATNRSPRTRTRSPQRPPQQPPISGPEPFGTDR